MGALWGNATWAARPAGKTFQISMPNTFRISTGSGSYRFDAWKQQSEVFIPLSLRSKGFWKLNHTDMSQYVPSLDCHILRIGPYDSWLQQILYKSSSVLGINSGGTVRWLPTTSGYIFIRQDLPSLPRRSKWQILNLMQRWHYWVKLTQGPLEVHNRCLDFKDLSHHTDQIRPVTDLVMALSCTICFKILN